MQESKRPFLIMAGGTGGHVMPALAIAQELQTQGFAVHWLGTKRGIESELVPKAGFPIDYIEIQGLRSKGLKGWLLAPFRVFKAFLQVYFLLGRLKPQAVMSMGGYVAGPGGLAAWSRGIPLVLHEQNAVSGLTNRLLAPFAKIILMAFPKTFNYKKVVLTGNPVRSSILALGPKRLSANIEPLRVLVVGGSLGAMALNELMPKMLKSLDPSVKLEVWHQTGQKDFQRSQQAYEHEQVRAKVEPFIYDMAKAYEWAELVICRSGALTVSELAVAGNPSILVPFPYAVDDHQSYNARYLADAGAAILLPQSKLNPVTLSTLLSELFFNRARLQEMSRQSLLLAKPEATKQATNYFIETSRAKRRFADTASN